MPCKGVKLGDMGPKFGYNSKNNGWATFDQVRIPRDYLLNKFVNVDREGSFSIEGDLRALFSVMMGIRVQLVHHSAYDLNKILVIAARYSVVRRQFKNYKGSKMETKLMDYQTQQMKILPLFAAAASFFISHSVIS